MRCHPDECRHSLPWGPQVPTKTRCAKPPLPDDPRPGYEYHRGWHFSTTLGGP